MATHRIAVIPGDGIGQEVVPEGQRVLEAAGRRFGIDWIWDEQGWGCGWHARHGTMLPPDGLESIAGHDAIFLGAVGWPTVPDHVSLWGLLIPIRRRFEQYVNLRPVRLFDGVPCPLAGKRPGDLIAAQSRGTAQTLFKNGRPVRVMHVGKVDATSMGALMMNFMLETILMGRLMGVNPFDQPGVEEAKVLSREYLAQG